MITLVSPEKSNVDITKKNWGYYVTPSVNGRLLDEGFKTAVVKNTSGQIYVLVVHQDKMSLFKDYIKEENMMIIDWLSDK